MILTNIALVALAATANNPLLPNSGTKVLYTVQENIVEISAEEMARLPQEFGVEGDYQSFYDEFTGDEKFALYEVATSTFVPRLRRRQVVYEPGDIHYTTFLFMLRHEITFPEQPYWPYPSPFYNLIVTMEYKPEIGKYVTVMNHAGISDKIAAYKVGNMANTEMNHHLLGNNEFGVNQINVNGALGCQYNNDFLANPLGAAIAKYSAVSDFNGGFVPANVEASTFVGDESLKITTMDRVLDTQSDYSGVSKLSAFTAPARINPRFMSEYTADSAIYGAMNNGKYAEEYGANALAASIGLFANLNAPTYFAQNPGASWLDGFVPASQVMISNSQFEITNTQVANDIMVARRNRMGNGAVANDLPIIARAIED